MKVMIGQIRRTASKVNEEIEKLTDYVPQKDVEIFSAPILEVLPPVYSFLGSDLSKLREA